jgi:hypothetical protein
MFVGESGEVGGGGGGELVLVVDGLVAVGAGVAASGTAELAVAGFSADVH